MMVDMEVNYDRDDQDDSLSDTSQSQPKCAETCEKVAAPEPESAERQSKPPHVKGVCVKGGGKSCQGKDGGKGQRRGGMPPHVKKARVKGGGNRFQGKDGGKGQRFGGMPPHVRGTRVKGGGNSFQGKDGGKGQRLDGMPPHVKGAHVKGGGNRFQGKDGGENQRRGSRRSSYGCGGRQVPSMAHGEKSMHRGSNLDSNVVGNERRRVVLKPGPQHVSVSRLRRQRRQRAMSTSIEKGAPLFRQGPSFSHQDPPEASSFRQGPISSCQFIERVSVNVRPGKRYRVAVQWID